MCGSIEKIIEQNVQGAVDTVRGVANSAGSSVQSAIKPFQGLSGGLNLNFNNVGKGALNLGSLKGIGPIGGGSNLMGGLDLNNLGNVKIDFSGLKAHLDNLAKGEIPGVPAAQSVVNSVAPLAPVKDAIENNLNTTVQSATGALGTVQDAASNVVSGVKEFGAGAEQLAGGDLKGLQTMGGAVVNTGSDLVANAADLSGKAVDATFAPLEGTSLHGLTAGNIKGAIGSAEGIVRGNVAGIQDLPTDIGKGAQHVLDQAGNIIGDLAGALGGGGGGGGTPGGITAPQYYKDLAQKQAQYGMNLPDQFQQYEGQRYTPPSDRTTAAETAIYNNSGNSQQAAFDRAGQLMNQGSQYQSTRPTANTYGNANASMAGPVNYNQQGFQQNLQQFQNPYTDSVVNQSLKDLDRARQMTANDISSSAAKQGAFGGSRAQLALAENNRNFMDRAGALAGQLRQQGFNTAAQMAQDEQMKRLGYTASDLQNVRGYQSQGNLAGQSLTAQSQENQQKNALTNAYNQAQFGQAANNASLNAAQLQGQLGGQMNDQVRQQMYDRLQMGQNQDVRNQAQADFDYQQFIDRTQNFPQQYINNLQGAGGLGSRLIYTQQPTSGGGQGGGLQGIIGGALSGAAVGGPWGALIGGGLGALGAGVPQNMSGLDKFGGLFDSPAEQPMLYNPNQMNQMGY